MCVVDEVQVFDADLSDMNKGRSKHRRACITISQDYSLLCAQEFHATLKQPRKRSEALKKFTIGG